MMGLFLAWGITEIILRIDEPGPETVSAGALAELEANTVQVSASQAALSGEARIPEIPEKHRPKIKENPTPTIVASPLPEPVVLEETFDPNVQVENFQSWMWRNHYWWQFDFEGTDALHLRWVGPDGQVKLQGWACENRVSTTIGRCYVGQSLTHFAPKPGTWSLYACKDAEFSACALVDQFDIAEGLDVGRSSAPK